MYVQLWYISFVPFSKNWHWSEELSHHHAELLFNLKLAFSPAVI